jgi:hypothetical protein
VTAITLASRGLQTLALTGMTNPVAIQSGENAQNQPVLYVAGGRDRSLRILDAANGQALSNVSLNFAPTSLVAFGSNSFVLRYRSQSATPLWLFSSSPQPGAYFVPAVPARQLAHQSEHSALATAGEAR